MNPNPSDNKFYVNEHLTSTNKALLFITKKFAKENDYTWVSNGKIFVRKKGR